MSNLISAIILAIVQGITEWLPVSSSGHLFIFENLLNYKSSMTFDVALHFGTLMSVFVYFGKDITNIIQDIVKLKLHTENAKLGFFLLIATIPAAIIGFFFKDIFNLVFSDIRIIAFGFGITGLFLIIASFPKKQKQNLSAKNSLIVGIAQIFSLFPGVSRSGATLSTSLLLGLKEKTALKFSFLLAIPVVFGANIITIGNKTLPPELIWATLASFIIGLITLHLLYNRILTKRKNLKYFGIYALLLSLILLFIAIF